MSTASRRSNEGHEDWAGRRIDFADFGRKLADRRAELSEIETPRNSGKRRTASKRALLKAIEEDGGKW